MTITNKVSNKTLMPGITPIADVPDAPTIGTATDAGTGTSATVTYTAAATGGAVTTFTATSTPGSFTGTGSSPITVSGLTAGTAYTFTVNGANSTGTSPNSAASNSVTPVAPSSYQALATATVTTSTNAITFNDIPLTGYKHLEIVVTGRSTTAGSAFDEIQMTVGNGSVDTGTNYSFAFMYGSGSNTSRSNTGSGQAYMRMGFIQRDGAAAGYRASNIIRIADYAATNKIKVIQCHGGGANDNSGFALIAFAVGLWNSTSAINYIQLKTEANWQVGSTATLYGIKDS